MKDYDNVYKLIRESHTVNATPRLIAEFNHNRYSIPVASNNPLPTEDSSDPDIYDIKSIALGQRPGNGIIKAHIGQARVSQDYEIAPSGPRYYITRPDDIYKYWMSQQPTSGVNFAAGTGIYPTDVNPQVAYSKLCKTNKIVIGFENTFAAPAKWEIWVQDVVGGAWRRIKTTSQTYALDSEGRVILYWNGTEWSQDYDISEFTTLAGIQIRVTSMTVANSYFNLIELGLRLQTDVTSYLMKVDDTFDLGDTSSLKPVGGASSNVAGITLFNHYDNGFLFNDENTDSLFQGLMEENAKFTLDYIYKINETLSVPIRQFEMYATEHWSASSQPEIEISLRDSSKFLQEVKAPALFYENKTVTGVIYRLLDSVGFDRYDIGKLGLQLGDSGNWVQIPKSSTYTILPFFWSDPEVTVWDTLQSLCDGTQTAIWFDAYDRLQVLTRNQAFAETSGKVWTLRADTKENELVDIASYEPETSDPSNNITVNYQTTAFEEFVPGIRVNSIVWQPEDDTVYVKSSDIQADIPADNSFNLVKLTPADAALWPFEGMMMIEAEIIKYKGKQFTYYPNPSNNPSVVIAHPVTVYLESYEDYTKYNFDSTPIQNRYLNNYSGYIKITERGVWNTPQQAHKVETISAYTQKNVRGSTASTDANAFLKSPKTLATYKAAYSAARSAYQKNKNSSSAKKKYQAATTAYKDYEALYAKYKNASVTDGVLVPAEKATIQLISNSAYEADRYLMAVRGSAINDKGYKYLGTRVRINNNAALHDRNAGIMFNCGGGAADPGYRVELCTSGGTTGTGRVRLYRVDSSGTSYAINTIDYIVLPDQYYSLDVMITGSDSSSTYKITVWVDGSMVMTVTVSGSDKLGYYGRFGVYIRAATDANFEYLYAIGASGNDQDWPENFATYDRLTKGFASARFDDFVADKRDVTGTRKVKGKLKTVPLKYTHFIFDEFGPIAHEIREFDAKYDTNGLPVLAPYVYWTNTSYADLFDVTSSSFDSKIYMINSSRDDAALQGTDDNHQFCVYGLVLKQRDVQNVVASDPNSIAAIGTKELTVDSKWIQTKEMAQALADWIVAHWSKATDSLSVEIFGNPLIEVGDVVALDVASADISEETHKYFVISARSEFEDGGMGTTLTLRRIRN